MKRHLASGLKTAVLFCVIVLGLITTIGTSGDSGDSTATTEDTTASPTVSIALPADGDVSMTGDTVSFISKITGGTGSYTYAWTSSQDGSLGTTANVTSSSLTAGIHEIVLVVTDTDGATVGQDTITITVGESSSADSNTSPVVSITAPSGSLSFNVGETITFSGTATDAEDGTLEGSRLTWSSDIDGVMGTGGSISTNRLSRGEHLISLTASDTDQSIATAFIIITVGDSSSAPQVTITSPGDGALVQAGDTLNLVGTATDFDGTPITGTDLTWISSKDGILATGGTLEIDTRSVEALNYDPLKEGAHTLYLRAQGSQGTGQASVTVTLANTSPAVEITNPPETCPDANTLCRTFAPGEWLNLQGTATDSEDGDLSGSSLIWKSHIDGLLGTGEILDIRTDNVPALGGAMTPGEHLITLEGKDEWGASGTDTVIITIGVNTPPVPVITYPDTDYTSVASTGYITFYGRGDDAEDGTLTSDDLEWYRSDQAVKITPEEAPGSGLLTSSIRLDLSTFASGEHTITLVARDSRGEMGVVTRKLTVP